MGFVNQQMKEKWEGADGAPFSSFKSFTLFWKNLTLLRKNVMCSTGKEFSVSYENFGDIVSSMLVNTTIIVFLNV